MADHSTQHHHDSETSGGELKSKTAFRSSFWFVLILVAVFIAALNFIEVMGHEGHGGGEATHHEAAATETHKGEAEPGHEADSSTQHQTDATPHHADEAEHAGGH